MIQIYEADRIVILKGIVSVVHGHMHINYRPNNSVSDIVNKNKKATILQPVKVSE